MRQSLFSLKMKIFEEELLEPLARFIRFKEGLKFITKDKKVILVDIGCGPELRFYKFAIKNGIIFKKYIGIDPLISNRLIKKFQNDKQITLIKNKLNNSFPVILNNVDYVVGFATLEHFTNPNLVLKNSLRALKIGGKVIFTTPSKRSKFILEFLSFKLGLISKREIEEHQNYFGKNTLIKIVNDCDKNAKVFHKYFELGMNNLLVITKK